jgi:hypothetical protein
MGNRSSSAGSPLAPGDVAASLRRSGDRLGRAKREEILALGPAAAPGLLELLEEEAAALEGGPKEKDGPSSPAPFHALELLHHLGVRPAVAVLLRLLRRIDALDSLYSPVVHHLRAAGAEALEPLLAALAEAEPALAAAAASGENEEAFEQLEDWCYGLLEALVGLGVREERIFQALVRQLAAAPGLIAGHLARYGDPRGQEPLSALLDGLPLDADQQETATSQAIEVREVAWSLEELGGGLTFPQRRKLELATAPARQFRQELQAGARARKLADLGRNDPCPCGSGKKLKHCHIGRESELGR